MKVFSQETQMGKFHVCVVSAVPRVCTIERVAFMMNIVPCRCFNCNGYTKVITSFVITRVSVSYICFLTNRIQHWIFTGNIIG